MSDDILEMMESKKRTILIADDDPDYLFQQKLILEKIGFDVVAAESQREAEKIIEKAKEANIPVHKDNKLAETLSRLEIGDVIPPELYEVVAEILVFVDQMDKIKAKMKK